MFLCYFIFANYEAGDENILLDSTLIATNTLAFNHQENWNLFPNPTDDKIHLSGILSENSLVRFRIVDHLGKTVMQKKRSNNSSFWDETFDVQNLKPGIYWIEWEGAWKTYSSKFVKL